MSSKTSNINMTILPPIPYNHVEYYGIAIKTPIDFALLQHRVFCHL